jgi:hypothetical protein
MRKPYLIPIAMLALLAGFVFLQGCQSVGEIFQRVQSERTKAAEPLPPAVDTQPPPLSALGSSEGIDTAAKAAQDEINKYTAKVSELLNQEKFDQLDQMANEARQSKARFVGGGWKLHTLYRHGLRLPGKGAEATDGEWQEHLAKLKRWVSLRPDSVTARIALAEAYVDYGWKARGNDYASKVTDQGWKLFSERGALAQATLDQASDLKEKCPEWFDVMQDVALVQGWEKPDETALFEKATAFEPGYYYYYGAHAKYLLEKWYGAEGESRRFVEQASSRLGGKSGDMLYFLLAADLNCNCADDRDHLSRMSWPRIQRGYVALKEQYGTTTLRLNQLARLAITFGDAQVAQRMFANMGENWDKDIWVTREYFESARKWSETSSEWTQMFAAVSANMQTPEGRRYNQQSASDFDTRLSSPVNGCLIASDAISRISVFLRLDKNGTVQKVRTIPLATRGPQVPAASIDAINACLDSKLKIVAFTPPPAPSYWVRRNITIKP